MSDWQYLNAHRVRFRATSETPPGGSLQAVVRRRVVVATSVGKTNGLNHYKVDLSCGHVEDWLGWKRPPKYSMGCTKCGKPPNSEVCSPSDGSASAKGSVTEL